MARGQGDVEFCIGDYHQIALANYDSGESNHLDDWSIHMLGALTCPGTPFTFERSTYEYANAGSAMIRIFGPRQADWMEWGENVPDIDDLQRRDSTYDRRAQAAVTMLLADTI